MGITVNLHKKNLRVVVPFGGDNLIKARAIPQRRWLRASKAWSCRPSWANMDYIMRAWPDAEWDADSLGLYKLALAGAEKRASVLRKKATDVDLGIIAKEIAKGLFKKDAPPPWMHQRKALLLGRDMPYFAYIMDQGTGKTRTLLDDAAHNYRAGLIDAVIIIAPNSVKTNWVVDDENPEEPDAVDTWLADDIPRIKAVWTSQPNKRQQRLLDDFFMEAFKPGKRKLAIIALNYEALNMDRAFDLLTQFAKERKVMIAADESTALGTPSSGRTERATELRQLCVLARDLTGTPIIKSPLKAYSQFNFLNEDILGFGSYFAFKARHCIMGGYQGRQVLDYINLEELADKIAACSFRVLKEDCLDLPPQIYLKRRLHMHSDVARVYKEMREKMLVELQSKRVSARIQLTQVMKLQQITGGYLVADNKEVIEIVPPDKNPLIKEVLALLSEAGDQRVIVWAHFKHEVDALVKAISKAGYSVRQFNGDVTEAERLQIRRDFKNGKFQVLVGNQGAGGKGIDEFKIACIVIYYSNSYSTEDRVQSEDRTHRGGSEMHEKITYYDFEVPGTVRTKIIATLRSNKEISDMVMRDGIGEWI